MKFSIIVPVYNVEKEVRQCLETIKNQSYSDFEAIFVDDCGSDSSVSIVEEFAANDDRFKIIKQPQNMGVSAARNTALDIAQGEYVVFVDADDYLELNALEVINNAFEKSGLDCVHYQSYNDDNGEKTNTNIKEGEHTEFVTIKSLKRMIGVVWNKAFRRSAIEKYGVRFPVGLVVEDSEFTFRMFVRLKKVYYIDDVLYNYRINRTGSITTEDNKLAGRIADEFKILERMYDYILENPELMQYKYFIVQMLGSIIKKILYIEHRRKYILKQANDLMKKMGFPENFLDIKQGIKLYME